MRENRNREAWLTKAAEMLSPMIEQAAGAEMPPFAVSVGWPSRSPRKVVGQCFAMDNGYGVAQMFISPLLTDPMDVLGTLAHEIVHAVDDCQSKHGGNFRRIAKSIGLVGRMTATVPGEALTATLKDFYAELGDYPHPGMKSPRKRGEGPGSRMVKAECPLCGYTIRTTKKWIAVGVPTCPCGGDLTPDAAYVLDP